MHRFRHILIVLHCSCRILSNLLNNHSRVSSNRVSSSLESVSNFLNSLNGLFYSFLSGSSSLVSARSERNGYDSSEHKY